MVKSVGTSKFQAVPAPDAARQHSPPTHWTIWPACVTVAIAAFGAYHNSLHGPFIFDDTSALVDNPTLADWHRWFAPPANIGTGGRPLLNFTFGLNHFVSGYNVFGYHLFNIVTHTLSGLLLFSVLYKTLTRPLLNARFGKDAVAIAFVVATIWTVHPLQTEAVTYISERAESLMALCYLLMLFCLIRSSESRTPAIWQTLSIVACFAGVMSKEIVVTGPVIAFLYDRTFMSRSMRNAWKCRWRYYLGLASSWILLGFLMRDINQRGGGIGFPYPGVQWWNNLATSCWSVFLYIKLFFWPAPLVLDYGPHVIPTTLLLIPCAAFLAGTVTAGLVTARRGSAIAFAATWFLFILAPTSLVTVVAQPIAEHRAYLSLAGLIVLLVCYSYSKIGRAILLLFLVMAAILASLTMRRNSDYRTAVGIWRDTIAKCPTNARAHLMLAEVLAGTAEGRSEAIEEYLMAEQLAPLSTTIHQNYASLLATMPEHTNEAISEYKTLLKLQPSSEAAYNKGAAYNNLGLLEEETGDLAQATNDYQAAIHLNPQMAEPYYNLGNVLAKDKGTLAQAIDAYQMAISHNPGYSSAYTNLGLVLAKIGGREQAAANAYENALRLDPDNFEAHVDLGSILLQMPGRISDAIGQYEAGLKINPGMPQLREALANAHIRCAAELINHSAPASRIVDQYKAALELAPNSVEAHVYLGEVFARLSGHKLDAIAQFEAALRLQPNLPQVRSWLDRLNQKQ